MKSIIYFKKMNVLELFNSENNKYIDLLPNLLLNDKSFDSDAEKDVQVEKNITTTINNKLEHAATFFQGLYLFDRFVSEISKDNLTKYFSHWISKLTQKLSNTRGNLEELHTLCNSISIFIKTCKLEPDLDKKISLYHVKPLVGIIVQHCEKRTHLDLLNLLALLLYYYPESCIRLQVSYSKIISSSLDIEDSCLIKASAKCYALMIRANERQFIHSYKENYVILPDNTSASCQIYYQVNICHYLHDIMDKLFQNFVTITSELPSEFCNARNNIILDLPEILQENIFDYYAAYINRFKNVCTYLSTLMKVGNSKRKFVLPNVILHVVCRGLSVSPAHLKKSDESRKDLLLLILPKLYTSLLNVLDTLITSFQQELVPFALNIQKLILQILEWTQIFNNEIFKGTRVHAYKLLSTWMKQTRSLSGIQLVADEVLMHVLKDISPPSDKVQMLNTNKISKHNSKADKVAEKQTVKSNAVRDSRSSNHTDSILCLQVLSTVESIVSNASCYLKQSFYDRIRNAVVLLLYDQYIKKTNVSFDKNSLNYRLQLLKTLRVLETYTEGSSSTSHAILMFELAVSQENNSDIIAEARLGLAELRHIIYPTAPSLMLPLEHTEDTSTEESSSKPTLRLEDILPQPSQSVTEKPLELKNDDNNLIIQPVQEKSAQRSLETENNELARTEKSLRRSLENDNDVILIEKKRTKLSDDTAHNESTNETSNDEVVILTECKSRSEIDGNMSDELLNGSSPLSNLNDSEKKNDMDVEDEEMALAFCDVE